MEQLNKDTVYLVIYNRNDSFEGKCENFVPTDKCAFINENNEMLLVHYKDIVQMKPLYQVEKVK